jgi:hypothetical protein
MERLTLPRDVKRIRSFLDHAGFYRRFIKSISQVAIPLTKLLQKGTRFKFNDECMVVFNRHNQDLVDAPTMKPPKYDESFEMICEASHNIVGVTLGQYNVNYFKKNFVKTYIV